MTDNVAIAVVTSSATLLTVLVTAVLTYLQGKKLEHVKVLVNSRMSEVLESNRLLKDQVGHLGGKPSTSSTPIKDKQ